VISANDGTNSSKGQKSVAKEQGTVLLSSASQFLFDSFNNNVP
jgi:hypothetical protein